VIMKRINMSFVMIASWMIVSCGGAAVDEQSAADLESDIIEDEQRWKLH